MHLFAPLLVAAVATLFLSAALPETGRAWLLCKVEAIERQGWLMGLLAVGFVCYWLFRLAFERGAYVGLIKG